MRLPRREKRSAFRLLSPPFTSKGAVERLVETLEKTDWSYGSVAQTLERTLEVSLGFPHESLILTDSATSALLAAHAALRPRRVCPLTWPATYLGITDPEWVDCQETGRAPDVDVGVDLWGIRALGAPPILDAAHRFGADEHPAYVMAGGTLIYSFAPTKEVPTPRGGALVTTQIPRQELLDFLSMGARDRVWQGGGGIRGLMGDPTAAFLRVQLKSRFHAYQRRQTVLEEYHRYFGAALLTLPGEASGHLAVLDCGDAALRNRYREGLRVSGIGCGHHYPLNDVQREACPIAAQISDRVLSLPCHALMSAADARRVAFRVLQAR